tara:strand:- start:107709 stop:108290 length:582 start_codon:yes stop_codon:yes gene_type:complete
MQSETPAAQSSSPADLGTETQVPARHRAIATRAKDALFSQLSNRLMSAMQSDGPAAAIEVCRTEAKQISSSVGEEYCVEIGRTSFKLRSAENEPRDWVRPFVEDRTDTPRFVTLKDGQTGAVFPIRMGVKCLMCHGQDEDIIDEVKPALAKLYPSDRATGFRLDELRGWFWVEVPGTVDQPAVDSVENADDDS